MIKSILRAVFPLAFLKQCFLIYNRVKISTIDRLLYRELELGKEDFEVYHEEYPFQVNNIDLTPLQGRAEYALMKNWMYWKQEEYLLELSGGCWIEPEYGWAIAGSNTLIYQSLAFSRTAHQRKPNLIKYYFRKKVLVVDKAISLRDTGEENYFHFYNDVLCKILFLKQHAIDISQYAIIVSKKLWDKPYFQYYINHASVLKSLNWTVQDQEYIRCSSAVFCKPMTHSKHLWGALILNPREDVTAGKRIFATRSKQRLRFLENSDEIEHICKRYGLEVIDADALSFEEQVRVFSQASFISGIHGAGLTNMVYRKSTCRILEIFPPPDLGYLPYHYILLAGMKNFGYRAIIGSPGRVSYSGGFYLTLSYFEKELKEFL